ncbi:hypothetical protein [Actinomadura fibrosa]|uniref:Glycosyltransferase n=1 Tax=Actinomadura fibrosa TaxID=111802 RepID=A0ABW2XDW5_9ACTN|nr:hypothetical protein [Actinomadura fibrosa]
MRIGYSFWGFLGAGITDTPDGGRSHRATLINGLLDAGHDMVFLQANRDLDEAGDDLGGRYTWDLQFPDIEVLFCEWRWPIPRRNTTTCDSPGHTCDLHRQEELLNHYTYRRHTPTLLWDKDLQLPAAHPLRAIPHVTVCEAALHPWPGTESLLFPVADQAIDAAEPLDLADEQRNLPLVYIGNQYDRDEAFDQYFAPLAADFDHQVAGKWTSTNRWPKVNFTGRIPFTAVQPLYRRSLTTVLLAPDRLAARGQFTQRLPEAVLAGCLPLAPSQLRSVDLIIPGDLIIDDATHAASVLAALVKQAGSGRHADLIGRCITHLAPFRLSRQLGTLERLLDQATASSRRR